MQNPNIQVSSEPKFPRNPNSPGSPGSSSVQDHNSSHSRTRTSVRQRPVAVVEPAPTSVEPHRTLGRVRWQSEGEGDGGGDMKTNEH
jgi:hypothetical protein